MVVGYFNIIGVSVFPSKADPPLIVDPDTVLTLAVALQGLEPVTRRDFKALKASCTEEKVVSIFKNL
jgi:hypothetical protein